MKNLTLYNTLTRKKEEFKPEGGDVAMYSCGPTVYNYAHIGNLRTYVFMDLIRRSLQYNGYKIKGVMNITDVGHLVSDGDIGEDKMQLSARRENKSPREIADYYTSVFMDDIRKLNIGMPEIIAKATDCIPEMIAFVQGLEEKGYAYQTSDGIYFDIAKFPDYGRLSGINLEEQMAGARVEVNDEKRHHADFALWKKAAPEHIMQWDSPWGRGYPGWHIECSAMCKKFLGTRIDIHSGGIDHIPIHHENEIAQSEALEGRRVVDRWMHGEFMLVDNGKMSKSLGNVYTVSDLEKRGYHPLDFRYFCLNAHYRKKLNFTFEVLDGARTALARLRALVAVNKNAACEIPARILEQYRAEFDAAVADDINVPLALGVVWKMLRDEPHSGEIYQLILDFDRVLGLSLDDESLLRKESAASEEMPAEITELANKRAEAKKARDFALADSIRQEIIKKGYRVTDTAQGYILNKESC
ncbi:MAG: cysteine--tRNA ligase [Firmicutes bacterium]|nr:cysteine--tRNA ligase [Bacillota bacterium]